jgi:tetratricopeptide (TPR) repeat protein
MPRPRQTEPQEDQAGVVPLKKSGREGKRRCLARAGVAGRWLSLIVALGVLLALLGAAGLARRHSSRTMLRSMARAPAEDPTEARLRQAVEAHPEDAAARMALGSYLQAHARPFEAMWEYAEVRHPAPADPALSSHLALVLQEEGALDQALALLTEALRTRPGDPVLRRQLADLYLAMAEPRRARQILEETRGSLGSAPGAPSAPPAREAGAWQNARAVITLGRARHASGDDARAVAAYQRALVLDKSSHEAWYRLGRLYLGQGRSDLARDAFFHAMFLQQSRPDYPLSAGMAYLQQGGTGDTERALRFFKDALALQPDYAAAHYQFGRALERLGRRRPALSRYSLAIIADPRHAEAHRALGQGLAAEGNAPEAHRYLGRYFELKDCPADAVAEFRRMEAAAPRSAEPALLTGQVYIRTGQSNRAVAVTETALKKHPGDAQLMERLAVLNINRGDWSAARRLLQRWAEAEPKETRPYWLLGRCGLGELKYAEAITSLEKAVDREPRNPHYLGFLGAALLKLDTAASRDRAAQTLKEAVALAPDAAEYQDLYAQALLRLGQNERARRQFLRTLDADPARIAAYSAVSQLAWRLSRPGPGAFFAAMVRSVQERRSEETLLWPNVWRHPDDAAGRVKLARFFCRTGRLDRARDQLEQAVALRPTWPEAKQLLATVQRCLEVQ